MGNLKEFNLILFTFENHKMIAQYLNLKVILLKCLDSINFYLLL